MWRAARALQKLNFSERENKSGKYECAMCYCELVVLYNILIISII